MSAGPGRLHRWLAPCPRERFKPRIYEASIVTICEFLQPISIRDPEGAIAGFDPAFGLEFLQSRIDLLA